MDGCARVRDRAIPDTLESLDPKNPKGEFAFFNVVYEDDSMRSNRRVPSELLGGLDGDEPAKAFIHAQDQEIAEKGGRPALEIKSISHVGVKKKSNTFDGWPGLLKGFGEHGSPENQMA